MYRNLNIKIIKLCHISIAFLCIDIYTVSKSILVRYPAQLIADANTFSMIQVDDSRQLRANISLREFANSYMRIHVGVYRERDSS